MIITPLFWQTTLKFLEWKFFFLGGIFISFYKFIKAELTKYVGEQDLKCPREWYVRLDKFLFSCCILISCSDT